MSDSSLAEVAKIARRRGKRGGDLRKSARKRVAKRTQRHENEATLGFAMLGSWLSQTSTFDPELTGSLAKALRSQYPRAYGTLTDSEIVTKIQAMEPAQLEGLANVKGKLFEHVVVDKLNEGESLGGIVLGPGQEARFALDTDGLEKANHPGFDIEIVNANGEIDSVLSLKCSEYVQTATDALEKYPNIEILGNSELASLHDSVIDSGISNSEIEGVIRDGLDQAEAVDGVLDHIGDFLPGLPVVIVIGKRGVPFLMGRTDFETAVTGILPELIEAGALVGVGALVVFLDGGLLSIPAMYLTRLGFKSFREKKEVTQFLISCQEELQSYCDNSIRGFA